ncbi:MAG TPA: RNase adapter RapZ [Vicinamibacterales bacterium]|nr:RNase adapter RapZ [Vicinamibacterales bacterium]
MPVKQAKRARPASARRVATPAKAIAAKASLARTNFLVVTGMSGAGKSHAIRALEDLGYYCVDNLPTPLIPVLADLSLHEDADNPKVAVVVDVRERRFIREFPPVWRRLKAVPGLRPKLIFLEASDAALLRRFSETRRPHPLAPDRPIAEALSEERQILARIRATADDIVDTSDLTVHELRQVFHGMASDRTQRARLMLTFESFGFKHGVPLDADLVFDCRFLPNPHFVSGLRAKTGKDKEVITYMRRYPATREFATRLSSFLRYVVPHYVSEGKAYLTVAIGCTGGRHRSVYLAESLKKELAGLKNVSTRTRHRDLARDST